VEREKQLAERKKKKRGVVLSNNSKSTSQRLEKNCEGPTGKITKTKGKKKMTNEII